MKRTGHATLPPPTPTIDRSISQSSTASPPATFQGFFTDLEPEPAHIVSDILPLTPQLPPSTPSWDVSSARVKVHPASEGSRKTKYATDEERRRATSIALKERWASGRMDNVHKKRVETLKWRKKADVNEVLSPTYGALIPDGYEQSTTTPGHPWICPVRSCRRVFPKISQIGPPDPSDPPAVPPSYPVASLGGDQTPVGTPRGSVTTVLAGEATAISVETLKESTSGDYGQQNGIATDHMTELGDTEALWNELQQYLTKHKGLQIPRKGWLQRLLILPKVRELDWNLDWLDTHPFMDTNSRDISALIIQMTGDLAPEPCDMKEPVKRNAFDALLDESRFEDIADDSSSEEETMESVDKNMEDASPLSVPGRTGPPTAIEEAEPGRPYTMWPAGYTLDTTISGRPWVCPVRTCRRAFIKKSDLGFHFERGHFAAMLNDNGDGTFSDKGAYQSKKKGIGRAGKILIRAPPLVVSKETLNDDTSLPEVQLPTHLASRPSFAGLGLSEEVLAFRKEASPEPETSETEDLWAYIKPHLVTAKTVPANTAVRHLLSLPRRRELEFNPRGRGFSDSGGRDVAALLIQLTGDEARQSCKRCTKGKGPFKGCIVMPVSARSDVKNRYPCCGNCLYNGKSLYCTLMESVRQRNVGWGALLGGLAAQTDEMDVDVEPTVTNPTLPAHARSLRVTSRQDLSSRSLSSTTSRSRALAPATSSALIYQGTFQAPDSLLEMEDWEVAPGRIKETTTTTTNPETIAFSKPYLTPTTTTSPTPGPHPVAEDVGFRIDSIPAGSLLQLEPDTTQMRLCSVAAGKCGSRLGTRPSLLWARTACSR
ncbi:hypothetical protein N0V88_006960 [Collariella sp. IMI 366227]|nr:hypothetical protein N0V88_006960 [Collariella sp. IMI 366227]